MTIKCFNQVILGFGMYFPPVNALSKKKCTVCCGIMNLHKLKVICYSDCMIDLNEHLAYFPEGKAGGNLVKLNWIKYFWKVCQMDVSSKRMYRGFTSKLSILKSVYIFYETIYEGAVENSYLKKLEQILTVTVTVGKWEEYPPCKKPNLRWVNDLSRESKCIYILQETYQD